MNKLANLALAAFAITLGAACEPTEQGPDATAWAGALPDQRILVSMPTDDGARAVGQTADSYVWTRNATQHVNGLIGFVLTTVDTITDFQPTYSSDDNEYLWGPWNDGGLDPNETALYVRHDDVAGTYGWAIIQRPKESTSDADWVPVVAGEATPGETEDTGSGFFVIDFDAIAALNPAESTTGRFASRYEISADGVSAEAGFEDFSENGGPLANALYRYDQDGTGAGAMDLGLEADTDDEGTERETIVLRTRWMADGQGRGDMVVFGGDMGPFVLAASQCWDSGFDSVYEVTNLLTEEGDASLCAFEAAEWNEDAPEAE
ncbi:MAG: hypothetical protein KC656_08490 [Myxococcales bacterium]|nr:hypothetical protein [Myxococcales bacterium]MCB9670593.1 hypothetical protein [Alphaproteobacteria bacterium]MCB9691914.1 hypothetical protein [Alphaproteobacteria bacterium]